MKDINDILLDGEEVLWSGKPARLPRGIFFGGGLFLIVFAAMMVWPLAYSLATGDRTNFDSISYSINGERITDETPDAVLRQGLWIAGLTFIPLLLFLLGWTYQKMRETYAVSDRRIIILSTFPYRRISSINPNAMPIIERSGNSKVGSLSFRGTEAGMFDKLLALYRIRLVEFTNIQNPGDVESLIAETFQL